MARFNMVNGVNVPFTAQEEADYEAEKIASAAAAPAMREIEIRQQRLSAYKAEADPLFFEEQRGEVPAGTHAAKVSEIKARFPKPE